MELNDDNTRSSPLINPSSYDDNNINNDYISLQTTFDSIFTAPSMKTQVKLFKQSFPSTTTLLNALNVHIKTGLNTTNTSDMALRKSSFHSFTQSTYTHHPYTYYLSLAFQDQLLIDLIEGAFVGWIVGSLKDGFSHGWIDSAAILISVCIVAFITALFNFQKQMKFEELLKEMSKKKVLVRRNGTLIPIEEQELLTGDILKIQTGDLINVTGVLLSGHVLCYDSVSKRSRDISCDDITHSLISSGLSVDQGEGEMVVILTKSNKVNPTMEQNEIINNVDDDNDNTNININNNNNSINSSNAYQSTAIPSKSETHSDNTNSTNITASINNSIRETHSDLDIQIHELSESIGQIGYVMGIVLGVIMLIKTLIYNYTINVPLISLELLVVCVDAYIISEAFKVVALPEGLPMAGNISLAFSITKMIEDNVLINHLSKIPSIAKMNYLLINKSSVTTGAPKVKEAFIHGEVFDEFKSNHLAVKIINDIVCNSTSKIVKFDEQFIPEGETVDNCLLNFLIRHCDAALAQHRFVTNEDTFSKKIITRLPFNPAYNHTLSIVENDKGTYTVYIKGFSESLLKICKSCVGVGGQHEQLSGNITKVINDYIQKCYTVIILAQKEIDTPEIKGDFYKDFIVTAVIGIGDDIQQDIEQSIKQCERSGIELKMLTRENIITSLKTCEKISLLNANDVKMTMETISAKEKVKQGGLSFKNLIISHSSVQLMSGMYGKDFVKCIGGYNKYEQTSNSNGSGNTNNNNSSSAPSSFTYPNQQYVYNIKDINKFEDALNHIKLLANADNETKQIFLSGIKQLDPTKNSIGITFNSIYDNDDTSLSLADITFSSNFTKGANSLSNENGDVILLNHSLSTIISSIAHARNIYDSIRKFIQFQLTVCLVTVIFCTVGNFYFVDTPLTPVQMLWMNIIMDSLGALALATDHPDTTQIMSYRPYDGKLFNPTMQMNILCQFLYQILTLLVLLIYGDKILGVPSDKTLRHHDWNDVNGYHISFVFNTFVFMQVFNLFNCRKVHPAEMNVFNGVMKNKMFMLVVVAVSTVQLLLVNFGGRIMRTQMLSLRLQVLSIGIAAFSLVIGVVARLLVDDDDTIKEEEIRNKGKKIMFYVEKHRKGRNMFMTKTRVKKTRDASRRK